MKGSIFAITAAAGTAIAQQSAYAQCGGQGWTQGTSCVTGYTCSTQNPYYAQCVPGTATQTTTTHVPTPPVTTTTSRTKTKTPTKTRTTTTTTPTTTAPSGATGVPYAGVNIAGFDFGCTTDGTCVVSQAYPPGQTGIDQMNHFVKDDGLNAFRLPVGWQYLLNNQLGGTLDSTNFGNYNQLVQGCLNSGAAVCIVDIHNYARWNGAVVGQGGPTNAQLANVWSQLATKYKGESRIAFGVMNEPHDLDITTWAGTVQAVVTAIRSAGATTQKILLPGTDYTSAGAFLDNGSGAALIKVTNPDGSTTNLIFDVHKYLDSDNSGTHSNCVTDNAAAFTTLGNWLRTNKRQAFLTETGGGPTDSSCLTLLCSQLSVLNQYGDVYLGWVGWAAGSFATTYTLSEVPTQSGGKWTDVPLVQQCIAGQFKH